MGKRKKVCATSSLHDPFDGDPSTKFVHGSKMRNEFKAEILGRVGKRWKKFNKDICYRCITMITNETGILYQMAHRKPMKQATTELRQRSQRKQQLLQLGDGYNQNLFHTADSIPPETLSQKESSQDNAISSASINECIAPQHPERVNVNPDENSVNSVGSDMIQQDAPNTDITLSLDNLQTDLQTLSPEIRETLAYHLASVERDRIRADTVGFTQRIDTRSLTSLSDLCRNDYLQGLNPVLMNFLRGLMDKPSRASSSKVSHTDAATVQRKCDIYKLAKVAESCMSLSSPISVLPFHFREGLLLYTSTRSRAALSLISATAPHGCYQTMRKWLEMLSDKEGLGIVLADKGDSVCMFDNNQVMCRRWNIQVNNTMTCNVVTMVMFMDVNPLGTLQLQESLKPVHWMWHEFDNEKKELLLQGPQLEIHRDTHYRKHFYPWLSDIIEQVVHEQTVTGTKCVDNIDKEVEAKKKKSSKVCPVCGKGVTKFVRKCPSCDAKIPAAHKQKSNDTPPTPQKRKSEHGGLFRAVIQKKDDSTVKIVYQKTEERSSEYAHLQDQHQDEPPEVTMGRPIFLNPCSYESVAEVFRQIGRQAGIKGYGSGTREWLVVICDGLPYVLGYQLIERSWLCNLCEAPVNGEAKLMSHKKDHEGVGSFRKEFVWVLLQPGPGHIEMNMLKTFVKFAWDIYWEGMVEVFNFRSENAKRTARNVSDHHKGWMLARIARDALAKELVLPYVRQRLLKKRHDFSVVDYINFVQKEQEGTANYALMFNLTFTILDSIFLYRAGVRSGDVSMMEAGKKMFSRMWCAQSHPLYRQLSAYDSIMTACMPTLVQQFVEHTKSFNLSGRPMTGQGGDFKLEEKNRSVQNWIPAIPKPKDWTNACANEPKLAKLKETTHKEANIKDPKDRSSRPRSDITTQVSALRVELRQRNFVSIVSSEREEEKPLTSYNGKPLNKDLVTFAKDAAIKERIFLESFILHKERGSFLRKASVPYKEAPIFVTEQEKAEFHDIRNKTIAECTAIINTNIATIENQKMREEFQEVFDGEVVAKKVPKAEYLEFHDMLENFLDCFIGEEVHPGINQSDDTDDIGN